MGGDDVAADFDVGPAELQGFRVDLEHRVRGAFRPVKMFLEVFSGFLEVELLLHQDVFKLMLKFGRPSDLT